MLDDLNKMIMQMRSHHKELVIYCGREALQKLAEGSSYIFAEDGDKAARYLGVDVFLIREDEFKTDPNLIYVMPKEKAFDLKEVSILGQRVLI